MNGETLAKIIVADLGLPTSYEMEISNQVKNSLTNVNRTSIIENENIFNSSHPNKSLYPHENKEKLCTIILNIKKEGIIYKDKFEWDILNKDNNPEEFAQIIVEEMGLPQTFQKLINFQIRKQVKFYLIHKLQRFLISNYILIKSDLIQCMQHIQDKRNIEG